MGTVKVTNIEPIADNGTTTFGSSGDTLALATGTKLTGHGLYVVEKITRYTYNTEVTYNAAANTSYVDIAGGNTINWTPTSTNDIFWLTGGCTVSIDANNNGLGVGIMRDTSSSITSSSTSIYRTGRHTWYMSDWGNNSYNYMQIVTFDQATSLTTGTTYYYEMNGMAYGGTSGTKKWNLSSSDTTTNAKHNLQGIHYKYIGT